MLPMRILHLASFSGNIGDNANHMGFRPWFAAQVGREVTWTNCEIREFYWKERAFDADFVTIANSYDALVVGGGNYFELWVENSPTGTSIAISLEDFDKIRVPIFFNALGVDSGQGVPEKSKQNFTRFLSKLLSSDQYLVSVRNDGAVDTLREEITDQLVMNYSHGELSLEAFERRLDEAMATTDHDVMHRMRPMGADRHCWRPR